MLVTDVKNVGAGARPDTRGNDTSGAPRRPNRATGPESRSGTPEFTRFNDPIALRPRFGFADHRGSDVGSLVRPVLAEQRSGGPHGDQSDALAGAALVVALPVDHRWPERDRRRQADRRHVPFGLALDPVVEDP